MKIPIRLLCWAAVAGLLLPGAVRAEAVDATKTLSPYFYLPEGEASGEAFPLKETDVDVVISGVIADVTVRQTYANMGNDPIEAVYVFPASTRAAVHGMTMQIGERRIEAAIQERQQAKKTFEAAKAG